MFETGNTYNSLDCGEEEGDATEEEAGAHAGVGEHVGAETDETAEEATRAHVGSDVEEGVLGRGVGMLRSAFWTIVGGVGGAIGRIATAPLGRVKSADKTADKTHPVRKFVFALETRVFVRPHKSSRELCV